MISLQKRENNEIPGKAAIGELISTARIGFPPTWAFCIVNRDHHVSSHEHSERIRGLCIFLDNELPTLASRIGDFEAWLFSLIPDELLAGQVAVLDCDLAFRDAQT